MFTFKRFKVVTLLFALLCLFLTLSAVSLHAQDVTVEAPVAEVTPIFGFITPTDAPVETPVPAPAPVIFTPENSIGITTLIYNLVQSLLMAGGALVIFNRFFANKSTLDALEKLYQSQSPEQQANQQKLVELAFGVINTIHQTLVKVMDGQPNDTVLAQAVEVDMTQFVTRADFQRLQDQLANFIQAKQQGLQVVNRVEPVTSNPQEVIEYLRARGIDAQPYQPPVDAIGKALENLPDGEVLDVPVS